MVMNMKKILSIIISTLIILLSLSIPCFASDTVFLSLQNETVYAGDEFTVNLFVSDNSKISGAVIDIKYDKTKLEFVSAKEGAILDAKATISIRNISKDNAFVRFTYMSGNSSIISEGILFSITFKALETSTGKTDLEISIPSSADFVSESLEKLPYSVRNSSITILNEVPTETTTSTELETEPTEIATEDTLETETVPTNISENDNNSKDSVLAIILVLIGFAFICFGVAIAIKKKRK